MGYARKSQISLQETPYYHCVARCVRRCWLWGIDRYSKKDYSHRKEWVIERLRYLSRVFAIDVCAYAVMSNHYHTVLCVEAQRAKKWSEQEVIDRWTRIFSIHPLVQRYINNEGTRAEHDEAKKIVRKWRRRLMDISWFMRCLNEYLARRANEEDNCTGRFWEGRFKSQALLDEAGLLTAMAYVDLNPIRAGIALIPEESEFTSIYERIKALQGRKTTGIRLKRFRSKRSKRNCLPISLSNYIQLVDWTGRVIRPGKRGSIDRDLPPILERLNIDKEAWIQSMRPKGNVFGRAMGKLNHLQLHAKALGQSWIKGLKAAERMYS